MHKTELTVTMSVDLVSDVGNRQVCHVDCNRMHFHCDDSLRDCLSACQSGYMGGYNTSCIVRYSVRQNHNHGQRHQFYC